VLAKLGLASAGTTEGRTHNFTAWRTLSQTVWLFVISSVLFGVPYFAQHTVLKYLYWPTLSSRFLTNNPTSCVYYGITSGLVSGYSVAYVTIVVPLAIFFMLVILLGRAWCGWTCPIGFAQELIGGLRRLVGRPYRELHPRYVIALDRFKYAFLFFVILIAISSGIPGLGLEFLATDFADPSCQLCPARPLCTIAQWTVGAEALQSELPTLSFVILAIFLVGTFGIRRFWCRICPLGAMMAPVNRSAMLTLRKDGNKCTRCRACLRVCPMDIEEVYAEMERTNITAPECIHCYRCVEECPEKDCLTIEYLGKTISRSGLRPPKRGKTDGGSPPVTTPVPAPAPIPPEPGVKEKQGKPEVPPAGDTPDTDAGVEPPPAALPAAAEAPAPTAAQPDAAAEPATPLAAPVAATPAVPPAAPLAPPAAATAPAAGPPDAPVAPPAAPLAASADTASEPAQSQGDDGG
jgi:polyferredoxin